MRHLSMIVVFVLLGGLVMTSQAMAIEQNRLNEGLQVAALTGEQLRQFQMHPDHQRVLNREQVTEIVSLLRHRGYNISSQEKDSIGPETRAALRSFQEDRGLAVTGRPDEETLRALVLSTRQHEMFGIAPEFGEDVE